MYVAGREINDGYRKYQRGEDIGHVVGTWEPYVLEAHRRCGAVLEVTEEQAREMQRISRANAVFAEERKHEQERKRLADERERLYTEIVGVDAKAAELRKRLLALDAAIAAAEAEIVHTPAAPDAPGSTTLTDCAPSAPDAPAHVPTPLIVDPPQDQAGQGTSARPRDDPSPGDGVAVTAPPPPTIAEAMVLADSAPAGVAVNVTVGQVAPLESVTEEQPSIAAVSETPRKARRSVRKGGRAARRARGAVAGRE